MEDRREKEKREVSGSHPWMPRTSWPHPSGPSFPAPFSWTLALFLTESPKHLNCLKSGGRSLRSYQFCGLLILVVQRFRGLVVFVTNNSCLASG